MTTTMNIPELLGRGLYNVPEAARLVGISPSRARRWVQGYRFAYPTTMRRRRSASPPVVKTDLPKVKGFMAVSFVELVELFVVGGFLRRGVSLGVVRLASGRASERLGTSHPFAYKKFKTDGKGIFLELGADTSGLEANGKRLLELTKLQYAFPEILADYLEQVEFELATDMASQWWPLGKKNLIVLDPSVAFGAPVIAGTRIPVVTIMDALKAGETKKSVCYWYNVNLKQVQAAIRFHKQRLAA